MTTSCEQSSQNIVTDILIMYFQGGTQLVRYIVGQYCGHCDLYILKNFYGLNSANDVFSSIFG